MAPITALKSEDEISMVCINGILTALDDNNTWVTSGPFY